MITPNWTNNSNNRAEEGPSVLKIVVNGDHYHETKEQQRCMFHFRPFHQQIQKPTTTKFVTPHGAKRVRFSKKVQCCHIKRHEEPDKIWFTQEEMNDIWDVCWMTIDAMTQCLQETDHDDEDVGEYKMMDDLLPPIGDEELCSRGFEQKTPMGAEMRNKNKRMSKRIVLIGQLGELDDVHLAQAYHSTSREARRTARARGKSDEREAMAIFRGI